MVWYGMGVGYYDINKKYHPKYRSFNINMVV